MSLPDPILISETFLLFGKIMLALMKSWPERLVNPTGLGLLGYFYFDSLFSFTSLDAAVVVLLIFLLLPVTV